MKQEEIQAIIAQLTLEEKAGLCSGRDNWHTKAIERLAVPACRMSDGPHGLRTQAGSSNSLEEEASLPAVCFPSASASAASFDRDLMGRMGQELGRESQALGVQVLLGPGINMKRSPLCGRNFEYFSEDPYLAGELGAAFVEGLQSQGVGASLKHFFANNQEYRRMDVSAEIDERTLREIYLCAFETVVKKAQPWTVMAAYNKIGGVYATANRKYLTDVLRDEWGFKGLVVSDWGAVHDRAAAIKAGCDLTMPAEATDNEIVKAVQDGRLAEGELDASCERVLALAFQSQEQQRNGVEFDFEGGHALAREIAEQSIVLLKNDRNLLPLNKTDGIAFIGAFAAKPRYQGGGSSHIHSFKVANALETAQSAGLPVEFALGYDPQTGATDDALVAEAVALAKTCAVAVVFAGLPDSMESEGVDRKYMRMPDGYNRLIEAICAVQPNTVVVLHNGSPVEVPWADSAPAILEAYLGGQAVGEAVVNILYGDVNPSGHLAESFPFYLADNPSYLFFPGEGDQVLYSERMFIGYRYYASKEMTVRYPFGHGLSYTTFRFDGLILDKHDMSEDETVTASVTVTNTGVKTGRALVQLYVAPPKGEVIRPLRELKAFEKLELQPGESQTITLELGKRAFAFWNPARQDWCIENGAYTIQIGQNAHEIIQEAAVLITGKRPLRLAEFTASTPMKQFAQHPFGKQFVNDNLGYLVSGMAAAGFIPMQLLQAIGYQPGSPIALETIEEISQRAGAAAGGGSGLDALLNQPISIMLNFMPEKQKNDFSELLLKMNGK